MDRQIKLSKSTETYLNAILDLQNITERVFEQIREDLNVPDSELSDEHTKNLLDLSAKLEEEIRSNMIDRLNFNLQSYSTRTSEIAVL